MAKKTFDHAVIYGGKLYPANTPIDIKEEKVDEPQGESQGEPQADELKEGKKKGKKADEEKK